MSKPSHLSISLNPESLLISVPRHPQWRASTIEIPLATNIGDLHSALVDYCLRWQLKRPKIDVTVGFAASLIHKRALDQAIPKKYQAEFVAAQCLSLFGLEHSELCYDYQFNCEPISWQIAAVKKAWLQPWINLLKHIGRLQSCQIDILKLAHQYAHTKSLWLMSDSSLSGLFFVHDSQLIDYLVFPKQHSYQPSLIYLQEKHSLSDKPLVMRFYAARSRHIYLTEDAHHA